MSRFSWRQSSSLLAKTVISLITVGGLVSGVGVPSVQPDDLASGEAKRSVLVWNDYAQSAQATSGGRSKGGSFGNDSSSSGSSSRKGSSRSSSSRSSGRSSGSSGPSRPMTGGDVLFVIILYGGFFGGILLLVFAVICSLAYESVKKKHPGIENEDPQKVFFLVAKAVAEMYAEMNAAARAANAEERAAEARNVSTRHLSGEITNDIVTVTQVQIAMLAQARHVQRSLNQIATENDLTTQKGLTVSLRETVLALLRSPETWTHAVAQTKTLKSRQAAKEHFESLSMEERSKFDVESLVNVDGQVRRRNVIKADEDEFASHIVVTLIVGTAHDSAVIEPVMSADELRNALKRVGSVTPEYLMIYEVLWSPQDEGDSLTDDELLMNYPKMFQIC